MQERTTDSSTPALTHVLVVRESDVGGLVDALRERDVSADASNGTAAAIDVTAVDTATAARESLANDQFDGVVVGQALPDEDGVELVADLRTQYPDVPVVMATAEGDGQVASDALAAGATDYVQLTAGADADGTTAERVLSSLAAADEQGTGRAHGGDRRARDREIEEYETILETIPVGVFVLDEDANILRVNQKATELVGLDRETALSMSVPDLVEAGVYDENVIEPYLELVPELLSDETDVTEESFQFTAYPDGEERVLEATVTLRPHDEKFRGTIGVFRDITERLHRQEQLEQQRTRLHRQNDRLEEQKERLETRRAQLSDRTAQLERQNERLDEFASMLSHELRNPLNTAQGHLKLGRRRDDEYFETVAGALDRMESMIENILTVTRQGKTVTQTEPVDVGELAAQCWHATDAPEATLEVELEGTVLANPARLRQLFENLYLNAVEHGGRDVTVTVGPLPEGAPATAPLEGFYVADDGPGIPPDDHDAVFEKGFTTATGGTGFGLSIVESVAEAHGWTVEVTEHERDDEDDDRRRGGARFEITGVSTPSTVTDDGDPVDSS